MEVQSSMPEPRGLDEVFGSIVSGLSPEAMVPERSESVSKAGARIMLEECLQNKLEKLAGQPVPKPIIMALTQERDKILVSGMRAFIPTHRKPCLGGGFRPRSNKTHKNRRVKSPSRFNSILNSTAATVEAEHSEFTSNRSPHSAKVSNSTRSSRNDAVDVPAYVIQDPAYAAKRSSHSAKRATTSTSHPPGLSYTAESISESNLRPMSRYSHTDNILNTTPMSPEDSFIQQDDTICPEASATFAYAAQTRPSSRRASFSPKHSQNLHSMTRPRTAATPISFPAPDADQGSTHSLSGDSRGAGATHGTPSRPTTAAAAPSRHFSPSPRRVLSAHNGRQPPRRPSTSAGTGTKGKAAATCIELSVRRVDTAAPAAMPRRRERRGPASAKPRQTYSPPLRSDAPAPRAQPCSNAGVPPRAQDREASPQRQIHSAPARGRHAGAPAAVADLAMARVEPGAVARDGNGDGLLPTYTLQFALGMVDRIGGTAVEAYSTRACSALYSPSTPLDPRKVVKLGRNWSGGGGAAALAAGVCVASVPLAHAQDGPRGAAGDALPEAVLRGGDDLDETSLLRRHSGFAKVLNNPKFNTQGAVGEFRPSSARSSSWDFRPSSAGLHSSHCGDVEWELREEGAHELHPAAHALPRDPHEQPPPHGTPHAGRDDHAAHESTVDQADRRGAGDMEWKLGRAAAVRGSNPVGSVDAVPGQPECARHEWSLEPTGYDAVAHLRPREDALGGGMVRADGGGDGGYADGVPVRGSAAAAGGVGEQDEEEWAHHDHDQLPLGQGIVPGDGANNGGFSGAGTDVAGYTEVAGAFGEGPWGVGQAEGEASEGLLRAVAEPGVGEGGECMRVGGMGEFGGGGEAQESEDAHERDGSWSGSSGCQGEATGHS